MSQVLCESKRSGACKEENCPHGTAHKAGMDCFWFQDKCKHEMPKIACNDRADSQGPVLMKF